MTVSLFVTEFGTDQDTCTCAKLTLSQIVKKFPEFSRSRRFIIVFRVATICAYRAAEAVEECVRGEVRQSGIADALACSPEIWVL